MDDIKQKIIPVLKKYHIKKAALFGSYARGDNNDKSDLDLLIEPPKGMGLTFVSLKPDLEELLHKEVDMVTYRAIHPVLRDRIPEASVGNIAKSL